MKQINIDSQLLYHPGLEIQTYNPLFWMYKLLSIYDSKESQYEIEITWETHITWDEKYWKQLCYDLGEIGCIVKIQQSSGKSLLHIECPPSFQTHIQNWIHIRLEQLQVDISLEKIEEYFIYLIYELQDKNPNNPIVVLRQEDFDSFPVHYDSYSAVFKEDGIIETQKYFEDLILLDLFTLGVISKIYFPLEMFEISPMNMMHSFGVEINTDFRYDSILDGKIFIEEVQKLEKDVKSITLRKTRKGYIFEKTRTIFGPNTRMIELLQLYPHSRISAEVYNGKIHKYTITEKILIKDIENIQE